MSSFRFQVITLFPEMVQAAMGGGVFSQAAKKDLLGLTTINPRDFTSDVHRTVDDRPFGGGDGMIMLSEPLQLSIAAAKKTHNAKVIYLSPQGLVLTAAKAKELAQEPGLILVCGRYGGIDQRVLVEDIDEEISVGDFVLSGGELAACIVMDAVSRFVPGVLGHHESAEKDSFSQGLLEQPNFTRPRELVSGEKLLAVPAVLLSGNHKLIGEWKQQVSYLVTLAKRPELLKGFAEQRLAEAAKKLWQQMPTQEKTVLGLETLTDADFLTGARNGKT